MILSREEILNAKDIEQKEVSVPEWGGSVIVRGLTAKERDLYEQSLINQAGKNIKLNYDNARAKLLALCIVGENGEKIFSTTDIELLGGKCSTAIDTIYEVAIELSGLKAKEVEDLGKN